ncbi:signal-regulatory protein beta-2-like isoform X2 [Cololabis saira]|uniref:signal-regulatory protein beta-2-like isoform X2 n=1 Tax=Cololabis saira TaxID=129043 RepID=UPI002AD34932|nr:signal-regulatory protein beta-2-like isoform X2 [Cololabis saira]
MLFLISILLMHKDVCCADDYKLETKTVSVGQNVTLTCTRREDQASETLHWIRLVSGNRPEFLGGTYVYEYKGIQWKFNRHITLKQEPNAFILHINKLKLNDTGLYFCVKVQGLNMIFLNGEFLRVKDAERDTISVSQVSPSDPVHPGEQITLDCSVFSDSQKKTCPSNVYWFRTGSDESHPSLIYAHKNSSGDCNSSPETHSAQKCDYSFSKTVSSTDAGTYYCAVASCGHILFGNGAKLEIKELWDLQKANTILFILCVVLTTTLIVISIPVPAMKMKTIDCCKDAVTTCGDPEIQERQEDSVFYSTAIFSRKNVGTADSRHDFGTV